MKLCKFGLRTQPWQVSKSMARTIFRHEKGTKRWRLLAPLPLLESFIHPLSELNTCVPVIELKRQKMHSQFIAHQRLCAVPATDPSHFRETQAAEWIENATTTLPRKRRDPGNSSNRLLCVLGHQSCPIICSTERHTKRSGRFNEKKH